MILPPPPRRLLLTAHVTASVGWLGAVGAFLGLGVLGLAADPAIPLERVRSASPVLHSSLALLVLLGATVLAIYKPRGLTPYGWRKAQERRRAGVR